VILPRNFSHNFGRTLDIIFRHPNRYKTGELLGSL
jgi:hypothetical protein